MARVVASERWSELWLDSNGQVINVMNNPMLGANGQITVTVLAFGGSPTAMEVILGPRTVEFDVNKLLVNLINVAIRAGSNNQARDVGELLNLVLCDQITSVQTRLACAGIASQLAQDFELNSGLGGVRIDEQRATIHDLDGNGTADALGLPSARGRVTGRMTNGLVSGALGSFPKSSWYGTKERSAKERVDRDRDLRGHGAGDGLAPAEAGDAGVVAALRGQVHDEFLVGEVDDPVLGDLRRGVEIGLEPEVEVQARIADFDDE
jgi:hypothetical protein